MNSSQISLQILTRLRILAVTFFEVYYVNLSTLK